MIWYFMQIVSWDNMHEILDPVFLDIIINLLCAEKAQRVV